MIPPDFKLDHKDIIVRWSYTLTHTRTYTHTYTHARTQAHRHIMHTRAHARTDTISPSCFVLYENLLVPNFIEFHQAMMFMMVSLGWLEHLKLHKNIKATNIHTDMKLTAHIQEHYVKTIHKTIPAPPQPFHHSPIQKYAIHRGHSHAK